MSDTMNYPQAQQYARKAHCVEPGCERKAPILQMVAGGYCVQCPVSANHSLAIAPSLFGALLKRWQAGEILFSLEGEIFSKTLSSMMRKDPDRWDYQEDEKGRVIRIGHQWASWYRPTEEESQMTLQRLEEQGLSVEGNSDTLSTRLAAKWPKDLTDKTAPQFLAVCRVLDLNPWLGEIVPFQGTPYVTVKGYTRKARESGLYSGLISRPATKEEWQNAGCIEGDILWTASVKDKEGNDYQAWGKVTLEEREEQRTGHNGQYYVHPVLHAKPMEMAENRAVHDAFERSGMLYQVLGGVSEEGQVRIEDLESAGPMLQASVAVETGERQPTANPEPPEPAPSSTAKGPSGAQRLSGQLTGEIRYKAKKLWPESSEQALTAHLEQEYEVDGGITHLSEAQAQTVLDGLQALLEAQQPGLGV